MLEEKGTGNGVRTEIFGWEEEDMVSLRELRGLYTLIGSKKHRSSVFEHHEQTGAHFHVGFRLCLKIHQSER